MKLSSSDRKSLIKLASGLPKGSAERRAILAGLSKAGMEHSSPEALKKYLRDHPKADKSNHTVKKDKGDSSKQVSEGLKDLNKAIQGGGMHLEPSPRQMKKIEKLVSQGASLKAIAQEVNDGGDGGDMKGAQKKLMDLVNSMAE